MTDPSPIPQALVEAMEIRRRRRRAGRRWQILINNVDPVDGLAASINANKHQRLTHRFRPEGWVTDF